MSEDLNKRQAAVEKIGCRAAELTFDWLCGEFEDLPNKLAEDLSVQITENIMWALGEGSTIDDFADAEQQVTDLRQRLQAAEERAEKAEAENAQLKLTVAWAKSFGAAHDMMQDALTAISRHADNQDIGHIDYRMHAKQQADHVLEACAGTPGLLDLAPTPKPDWRDGQWKWADEERAALKTEGA